MKLLNYTITAVLSATVLSACAGQNPFKRESNPVRNYPRVSQSIKTKTGLVPFNHDPKPPTPPPDNSQGICTAPFSISINGTPGTRLLKFPEDSSTTFEITISNRLQDEFEAKAAEGFPGTNVFRLLRKTSANTAVYQLAWNPGRLAQGQFTQTYNARIELSSQALSDRCQGGIANIYLDLLVEKSGTRPTVSVNNLVPQTPVVFGPNQEATFTVEVDDPSSTAGSPPSLNELEFRREAISGERTVINAVPATDCQQTPVAIPNTKKWKFACKFISSSLAEADVKPLQNRNVTATAVLFVSAKGANSVASSPRQVNIKVKFERVAAAAAPANGGR